MTNWEKAKWVWNHFPQVFGLAGMAAMGLVTVWFMGVDLLRHEWRQFFLGALFLCILCAMAYVLWWSIGAIERFFDRVFEWLDKKLGPRP
jgi:hypothetical protein